MGAEILGRNAVINMGFEWSETGGAFPDAWIPIGGDAFTQWLWSTENPVEGTRTLKVVNPSFIANVTGVMTRPEDAFPVAPGDVWDLEAFMSTDSAGKALRLILVITDAMGDAVEERHLKFTSTTSMQRYKGLVRVGHPAAVRGQVLVGMQDTGTIWVDYILARRLFPNEPELRREVIADEGRMFVANTGQFTVPGGSVGAGRLDNPAGSGRVVFVERVDFSTTVDAFYT